MNIHSNLYKFNMKCLSYLKKNNWSRMKEVEKYTHKHTHMYWLYKEGSMNVCMCVYTKSFFT